MERACNPCISNAQRAPEMRIAALQMATRLKALCQEDGPKESEVESLPEALAYCEKAVEPLERLLIGGTEGGEASLAEARAEAVRLRRRLEESGDHLAAA